MESSIRRTNKTPIRPAQQRQQYWATSVADAMCRKPGLVAFGEARDGPTIAEAVTVVTTGHPCISTMHPIGVSESARHAILAISPDQSRGHWHRPDRCDALLYQPDLGVQNRRWSCCGPGAPCLRCGSQAAAHLGPDGATDLRLVRPT